MYLSQLIFNLRSREARRDLSDRYELHRTLMNAFAEDLPDDERVLYRVEDQIQKPFVAVLVQSQDTPEWSACERLNRDDYLLNQPMVREVVADFQTDALLPFRLQANPTVKRDGKRHAIYADDGLLSWLSRKGEGHGFTFGMLDVRAAKLGKKHGKGRNQTWHAVQFDGVLRITKPDDFRNAVINGIGSAKAFGFGLLSVPYSSA